MKGTQLLHDPDQRLWLRNITRPGEIGRRRGSSGSASIGGCREFGESP